MSTTNVSSRASKSRAPLTGSGSDSAEVSEFKEGSIVSLKLKNFLVYKDAKAQFGPRLNMVVGPNGSGKSTLVCAIALGLGGSPKVLGRADNLSSFVMHGVKEDASVTVELFRPNMPNLHITRTFSRRSNKSNWHIDGRSQTEKQVKEKILALGIQVDNLCTMLPQDKVGDFSGFTPDKLLLETEKALSFDTLFKPHNKLIELQDSKGKTQNEEETMAHKLEGMESELAVLEKDVQRHEERQEKEEKLDLYKKRKVWWKVERLREMGLEAKQEEKAAITELRNAEAADKPLQDEFQKWERECERLRGVEKTRNTRKLELEKARTTVNEKIEGLTVKRMNVENDAMNLETRRKGEQNKLAAHKSSLEHRQEEADALREKMDQMTSAEELTAAINIKLGQAQDAKSDVSEQDKFISSTKHEIRETEAQIQNLTNQAAVREGKYKQRFGEEGKLGLEVRNWAARNSERLKGPVVGPIGLEVTVQDTEAASAVETHIPYHTWCSVVVTCKEDHDTIIKAFEHQKVSLSILINQGGLLRPSKSTFTKQEMARLKETGGVRGFLDDFIDCPDTVRQVLRRSMKIDTVFLGSAKTQQTIANDPEFLPRLGKRGANNMPTGSVIYAGGSHGAPQGSGRNGRVEPLQMYHTKISLYGARKPSVRVSEARAAQVLGPGLDSEAIAAQESKKAELERVLEAANEKREKKKHKHSILEGEATLLRNEMSQVSGAAARLRKVNVNIRSLEKSIAALEAKLASGGDSEKAMLKKRLQNILEQQAGLVAIAQQQLSDILDASVEAMAAFCARRIATDKLEDARDALLQAEESRQALTEKVDVLKSKTNTVRKQFAEERTKAEATAPRYIDGDKDRPNEFGKQYEDLPDNQNELDAVIDDLTDDLGGSVHNPQVVRKYAKLKGETEEVRKQLSELVEGNANASKTMENIREPWKEKLQLTVDRLDNLFSDYMSKMDGCCGEVKLAKNDSYKKWGIEIRVRFRSVEDQGKMAVLDKRVHSGGERSVSTILYLMALQDLQSSPFRVVDEINQGMDPRNERQVFSRIVLNSCGPNRKQYFLITPKLLQGLVAMDHKDMTVIFIMNGRNCITGTDDHTMQKFIEAKRRQKRQRQLADGNGNGNGDDAGGSPPQRRRIV